VWGAEWSDIAATSAAEAQAWFLLLLLMILLLVGWQCLLMLLHEAV
jgi:hypothetical protein